MDRLVLGECFKGIVIDFDGLWPGYGTGWRTVRFYFFSFILRRDSLEALDLGEDALLYETMKP